MNAHIKLAEDVTIEDYDKTAIDNFGKEMLYRMGWKDNQPLRKDGPIKPIEFKPRNSGLGLGADDSLCKKKKNVELKMSKVYGKKVKVREGKHKGLKGKLVDMEEVEDVDKFLNERRHVNVELKINKQIVRIESEHLRLRKGKAKIKTTRSRSRSYSKSKIQSQSRRSKLTWVIPDITVRVISKDTKYYNCKGVINDIVDLYTFSLYLPLDKTLHTEFTEDQIETVIPQLDSDVLVLTKDLRGEKGKLIQRDKKNDKVSVQLYSDMSIINLTQDDIALTANL